eukprot:5281225-Heterocapsa_arctica.AAC.1
MIATEHTLHALLASRVQKNPAAHRDRYPRELLEGVVGRAGISRVRNAKPTAQNKVEPCHRK